MTKQEQFFYDHAGYSYDLKKETEEQGHIRRARELAQAETFAESNAVAYEIEQDEFADLSWMMYPERNEPHEVIGIVAKLGGDEESLWGIVDADENYIRVVKAELALELLYKTMQLAK